jgi:hypothetical protein
MTTRPEWQEVVANLYDEEDYSWTDQRGKDAYWAEGQQINFRLKPWTKENAPRRHANLPHQDLMALRPDPQAARQAARFSRS